jgi:hypothetical protein
MWMLPPKIDPQIIAKTTDPLIENCQGGEIEYRLLKNDTKNPKKQTSKCPKR